jgi:hypothetical protein
MAGRLIKSLIDGLNTVLYLQQVHVLDQSDYLYWTVMAVILRLNSTSFARITTLFVSICLLIRLTCFNR